MVLYRHIYYLSSTLTNVGHRMYEGINLGFPIHTLLLHLLFLMFTPPFLIRTTTKQRPREKQSAQRNRRTMVGATYKKAAKTTKRDFQIFIFIFISKYALRFILDGNCIKILNFFDFYVVKLI